VKKIPMEKLKFLDEAHKDLYNRKVLGLRNHRVYMTANTIRAARASIFHLQVGYLLLNLKF
jgi:hypothetical protein